MHIQRFPAILLVVLAGLWSASSPAGARHLKLFVLTGQSNALGTTAGGEADPGPGTDPADRHVPFFWHNRANAVTSLGDSGGQFTTLQEQQGGYYAGSATHWGPEVAFARTLYRAGVRDFAVIKASRGGGGNTFWLKGSADDHMYQHVVTTVTAATAALAGAGHSFDIVGLLYVQGESDTAAEASEAGARFKTLVDNLRGDLPNAVSMFGTIGGVAAAGSTRDTVRANHQAVAASTPYIHYFSNLDLQANLYDTLHFDRAAKLTVGERFALAFFDAGIVARRYGRLAFIGDSITQGGNGDHPSYRYRVFSHLALRGVPMQATNGYRFAGSVDGPYRNSTFTAPDVNGQVFENRHDGHFGWRVSWITARVPLPGGRYNVNNLGQGTVLNWTGRTNAFVTADAGMLPYTGTNYVPDTASIMIGINDLADGVAPEQVRDDIGTLVDQLRAVNPGVRIHLNRVLHTDQGALRDAQVDALNGLLPALVAAKNAASTNSPVWLVDADTGFDPVTQTYDAIHPNTDGEAYVGDRIAASLGLLETPEPGRVIVPPPHIESGAYLPVGADADQDGLPDAWEFNYFNEGGSYTSQVTALTRADAGADDDADGMTNAGEYVSDTHPRHVGSVLKIDRLISMSPLRFQARLNSSAQRLYTLLKSGDLRAEPVLWTETAGPASGTDGPLVLEDSVEKEKTAYYRVQVLMP